MVTFLDQVNSDVQGRFKSIACVMHAYLEFIYRKMQIN